MKLQHTKILWIKVMVYLLFTAICIFSMYKSKRSEWTDKARTTFKEALIKEIQKRDTLSLPYSNNWNIISAIIEKSPGKVTMVSEKGEREYNIPSARFDNSIVKSGTQRSLLSMLLEEAPLNADSLCEGWGNLLSLSGIPLTVYTRISVSDWQENIVSSHSANFQEQSLTDSLLSCYIGYRCEVEATGYLSFSYWSVFDVWNIVILCLLFIFVELLFSIFERLWRWWKCIAVSRTPIIIEGDNIVIPARGVFPHIYQLEEYVFFDTERMSLINEETVFKLTPQQAALFELFLQAENHTLSTTEISDQMWPDGSGTSERIYTLIRRLRKSLAGITALEVIFVNSGYHLKFPISSNNMK